MNYEYTFKKKKYDLSKVEKAQIIFSNGDFITLSKKEILSIEVALYDKLVAFGNCYFPVAKSGFIKMNISNKKVKYDNSLVYDEKKYSKNRKSYIEKVCLEESVFAIRLFDELNWHDTIIGNIVVKKEEGFLIFSFLECPSLGSSDSENHFINLKNINKKNIRVMRLDFENCDGIDVYQDEIKQINLNFEKELSWNSNGYVRVIKSGYIRLKLNKDYNDARRTNIYVTNYKPTIKQLEKRICGNGEDDVDICNLYISNRFSGYGLDEEVITLNDLSEYPDNYGEDDCEDWIPYVTGYAKKERDGSILIVIGEKREKVDKKFKK